MNILGIALVVMIAHSSELPGAADATFEQRWEAMVMRHQLRKESGEITTPREETVTKEPRHRVREHRHRAKYARSATGCRFGHKVHRGLSWRCVR